MKISVCKVVKWEIAHYLPNYKGKCNRMHGHSLTIELKVSGLVGEETGMVIDFLELKDFLKKISYDHSNLNQYISNPTAENIALILFKKATEALPNYIRVESVKVWETSDNYAEVTK